MIWHLIGIKSHNHTVYKYKQQWSQQSKYKYTWFQEQQHLTNKFCIKNNTVIITFVQTLRRIYYCNAFDTQIGSASVLWRSDWKNCNKSIRCDSKKKLMWYITCSTEFIVEVYMTSDVLIFFWCRHNHASPPLCNLNLYNRAR